MTLLEERIRRKGGGPPTGGKSPCPKCGHFTQLIYRTDLNNYKWCGACGWRSDTTR